MFQPLAHLHVRQLTNGRKGMMLLVLALMPIGITALYMTGGATDPAVNLWFLFGIYPYLMGLLVSLVYGTSIMHAEIDGKTLVYLFTRPVPKWKVVVAKYVATVGFIGLPMMISLGIAWSVLGMPGGIVGIGALVIQLAVGLIAWTGIFAAVGLLVPKHAVPVGIVYALVMELVFTLIPALVNYLTINFYQRSIMVEMFGNAGQPPNRMVGDAPLMVALLVPVLIGGVGVAVAAWVSTHRQFVESHAQAGA
ncbi:MAG: ABC transporter permease [Planctomycetota bacterium]